MSHGSTIKWAVTDRIDGTGRCSGAPECAGTMAPHVAGDAAVALLEVGGAPGAVKVVQGNGAGLHVGTHPHAFCAADQDGDAAVAAGGEQFAFLAVVAGFVHEPHPLGRDAAGGE